MHMVYPWQELGHYLDALPILIETDLAPVILTCQYHLKAFQRQQHVWYLST